MTINSIRDRYKPISKNTKTLDPLLYYKKGGSINRVHMHRPSYIYNVSIFMSISIKYLKEMKCKRTMKYPIRV